MAQAVGYRPIFSSANQMSSLIDLAIQSTIGVKSNFSETLDSNVSNEDILKIVVSDVLEMICSSQSPAVRITSSYRRDLNMRDGYPPLIMQRRSRHLFQKHVAAGIRHVLP